MNSKITLPRLVALMAASGGTSKRQCEEFLKALFAVVTEALVERDQVKVRGLGTFRISRVDARKSVNVATGEDHHIPAHDKIVFIPDKEMAAAVNAPFEMFETVELSDDISDADLDSVEAPPGGAVSASDAADALGEELEGDFGMPEPASPFPSVEDSEENSIEDSVEDSVAADGEIQKPGDEPAASEESVVSPATSSETNFPTEETGLYESIEEVADDEDATADNTDVVCSSGAACDSAEAVCPAVRMTDEEADDSVDETPVRSADSRRFGKGFLWGFLCALVLMVAGFFVIYYIVLARIERLNAYQPAQVERPVENVPEPAAPLAEETAGSREEVAREAPPTAASDAVVYDTITNTRYLTTMARDHYGNFNLWAYIYKENESFLGHPDRIRPGTRVVIPDLRKYGIDPSNPEDVRKGTRLGQEIYSRYGKR